MVYLFIDFIYYYYYFLIQTLFSATFADLHTFPIRLLTFVQNKKLYPSHPDPTSHQQLDEARLWTFPFHSMFLVRRWVVVHLNAQQFVNEPTHMAIWGLMSFKRTMQDFFLAMIQDHEMIEYFGQVPANSIRPEISTPTHTPPL